MKLIGNKKSTGFHIMMLFINTIPPELMLTFCQLGPSKNDNCKSLIYKENSPLDKYLGVKFMRSTKFDICP